MVFLGCCSVASDDAQVLADTEDINVLKCQMIGAFSETSICSQTDLNGQVL